MKRILIPVLMMLAAATAYAQENNPEDLHQKFFDAKIREFVYQLELTDAQKAAFIPIYKRYDDELMASRGEHQKPQQPAQTSAEAAERLKANLNNQKKTIDIRLKYVDEFATVLEPRQLRRLFKVEQEMQQKLMSRQGQGGPGKGGFGPGKGFGPGQGGPGGPRPGKPTATGK